MGKNTTKSLGRILLSLSSLVILSKLLGFARNIVMADAFGASIETDLVTLAHTLVTNTEYVITQTLATAFVPVYLSVQNDHPKFNKTYFSSCAIKLFLLIAVALSLIITACAPLIAKIIAPTYSGELSVQLTHYIRLLAPILIPFVLLSVFKSLLNAHEKYIPGEMVSIIGSTVIITLIFLLSSKIGINAILLGIWLSSVISAVFLAVFSKRYWTLRSGNPFQNEKIIVLLKMVAPLLFGYAMVFINQQIDKIIVSGMAEGTVTAMSYGNNISQLVVTLIASFCMVMYTRLSIGAVEGAHEQNAGFIVQTLSVVITILIPVTIISVICSRDIVKIIFEHGAFDSKATANASYALSGYGLMFIPYTIKSLFSRYLYSNQNTKQPVRNNTIGILSNIILSLALYKPLGVFGVTFASSFAELVAGILNIRSSKQINSYLNFQPWKANAKYWLIGTLLCTAVVSICRQFLLPAANSIVRLFVCVILGLLFYFLSCFPIIRGILQTVFHKKALIHLYFDITKPTIGILLWVPIVGLLL